MKTQKWLSLHTSSLLGKTVVVTGATGGLGGAICRAVLYCRGRLILVNRSREKTEQLQIELLKEYPGAELECMYADLTDMASVRQLCGRLEQEPVDILILNAGAYSIPRKTCDTGWDNVFQTNFVSHYYMVRRLLPLLEERKGRVVAVGSIAHWYSKTDPEDIDFAGRSAASLVYGNSKRYLMFALSELLNKNPDVQLVIAHPGISFTNITAHYPKLIFAVIKWPMKVIFMKPASAARSIVRGMFEQVPYLHWIGPRWFNIWGNPSVKKLNSAGPEERERIFWTAEKIYRDLTAPEPTVR